MEPGQGSRTMGRASHLNIQSGMKSSLALQGDRGIELVDTTVAEQQKEGAAPGGNNYFGSSSFGGAFVAPLPKKNKGGE